MLDVNNVVFLWAGFLGTGLLTVPVLWFLLRDENAPDEPKFWVKCLIPVVLSSLLGVRSWSNFADLNNVLISIFLGFGIGYFVAPMFYHPRIAVRGALIGIKLGLIFTLLLILLETLNGFDPWSITAWIFHLMIPLSTAFYAAIFACQIMRCRPIKQAEKIDPSTQLHPTS